VIAVSGNWRAMTLAIGLLSAGAALAQDDVKVPLRVDVVTVSNNGDVTEPESLSAMRATFARKGLNFTAFRQLSSARIEVGAKTPTVIKLPNGREVSLRLEKMEKGSAQVKLAIPGLLDETLVTLGKKGTVYQQAGSYQSGKLVLVLNPAR